MQHGYVVSSLLLVASLMVTANVAADTETSETDAQGVTNAVEMTVDNWCQQRAVTEWSYLSSDFVGFVLKKGTLEGNMERLVANLYPNSNGLINKTGRHLVPGDVCLTSIEKDALIQQIVEPYYAGKTPIVFATFTNEFYGLFYKDDAEFSKYLVGVRK